MNEIFNNFTKLKKYPGKGGWTYSEILLDNSLKNKKFGWVKVHGFIDQYSIDNYSVWTGKNGHIFVPIKKIIREKIKKEAGDTVHLIIYTSLLNN